MKVLIVTQGKIASGAEKITSLLYGENKNKTVVLTGSKPQEKYFKKEDFKVKYMEGLVSLERKNFRLSKLIAVIKSLPYMRKYIKEYAPSYIHVNNIPSLLYVVISTYMLKKHIILHVHDYYSEDRLVRIIAKLLRRQVTKVICVSNDVANDLVKLNYNKNKIKVIHNGIELNQLPRKVDQDKIVIGFIGALAEWKGLHILFKSAINLREYKKLEYWIIGPFVEDGYEDKVREIIGDYPELKINFLGSRTDIHNLLSSIDLLVHCSIKRDPFPTVVLEGMHAGCTVVASDNSGAKEIIIDMRNGILHKAGSVESLTNKLKEVIKNDRIRASIGKESREFAREQLSFISFRESFFKIVQESLEKK
ncbi:glycosyltransferase family 4 protein [Niallia sp. 03133]|uniref:glycosyltransferase family 4 protein n=1 Tax=Niallia sp. 03133 TaxID=3458060 RepID=UPI004043BBC1